jgi:citrate synthase
MFSKMMTAPRVASSFKSMTRKISSTCKTGYPLKDALAAQIPIKLAEMKDLRAKFGDRSLGEVTVDQCIGGGRGIKAMYYETSLLDSNEGIRFRGYTIPELQEKLPSYKKGGEPLPEALIWLLLTSKIPTEAEAKSLTDELAKRATLPAHIEPMIRSFPKTMHPMTQLTTALNACQTESKFYDAYHKGIHKSKYWEDTLEDILDVIAKIPEIAALIYRCTYADGVLKKDTSGTLDYSASFNRMLGYDDPAFDELMRLYLVIHSDHEGGNASAHTTHLVGSTLADPYLSMSAGLNALAGPLHGLANQEVLGWIQDLEAKFKSEGKEVSKDTITQFAWDTLNSGKVIPGYGHAVLRKTDPRYECQRQFALKYLPDDPLFKIVSTIYDVMPGVLTEHGKTKNPYPNVDSHSGVLLWHYGFKEFNYYTVLFGVSRAMGALSQVFWDRALGMPLERPKSVNKEWIEDYFEKIDHLSK